MFNRNQRRMPSLDGLRAFEVAARCLSFTKAGQELFVTQGAVSQRIKALEQEIGAPLFHHRKAGLALTPGGQRLAESLSDAIGRIRQALDEFGDDRTAQPLKLSVLPSFALCWMLPRLHRLAEGYPATRVELLAQREVVDLRQSGIDLAVRFGAGCQNLPSQRLMGDGVVPVCAPALLGHYGVPRTPAGLVDFPILYDSPTDGDESGSDWASWLRRVGCPGVVLPPGQHFGQADLAIEAAVRGLGVTLARLSLIGEHLAAGRLVRLSLPALPTAYAYHLVWRPETDAATRPLRTWLQSEAAVAEAA